ncbi:MAG: DNA sulfur modification protein DndB [Bryobacterales bacterium]|nr:DNA sulfur modification protein DndB [Bryobacterales bacterium]
MTGFEYVFPAIRGIQASREYYVSMCPMRLLPKIFLFDEEELVPELRAQRLINKSRLPEMTRYITSNPDTYVFSAITVSVDAKARFESVGDGGEASRLGMLHIPMSARFIINDGQHRRAAMERALRDKPDLGDETIAVVFFLDPGLRRCQQMFADLNRYAIRPSKSLSILYDYRDDTGQLTKALITESPVFRDLVELEKTSLAPRSRRLFTLSALYHATAELLASMDDEPQRLAELAVSYWEAVASHLPEWQRVRIGELSAGEVRTDFIHTHGVVLQALGRVGNALVRQHKQQWPKELGPLECIDWRRSNSAQWEGRALSGGRISKSGQSVLLTANVIKERLGLPLTPEEQAVEEALHRGINHA